ncbi:cellulose binding domain-containing protein [Kitasatospora arboriphila]
MPSTAGSWPSPSPATSGSPRCGTPSWTQSGKQVVATNPSGYNTVVAPGASVNFGFSASSVPGTNGAPADFRLNGQVCSTF